jgi:hypothetical protein
MPSHAESIIISVLCLDAVLLQSKSFGFDGYFE